MAGANWDDVGTVVHQGSVYVYSDIVAFPLIEVTPSYLTAAHLPPPQVTTDTLALRNPGTAPLEWSLHEAGAVTDCRAPGDLPWLAAGPASGTTAPGTSSTVMVTLDSTGLSDGRYRGTLCIVSNAGGAAHLPVPVTLTVGQPLPGRVGYLPLVWRAA